MRSAIRSFQQRERLTVAGVIGPDTERALFAMPKGKAFQLGRRTKRRVS